MLVGLPIPSYRSDTTASSIEGKVCKALLLKVSRVSAEKTCDSHWRLVKLGEGEAMSYWEHRLTIFFKFIKLLTRLTRRYTHDLLSSVTLPILQGSMIGSIGDIIGFIMVVFS